MLQVAVGGLSLGVLYAIIALGYTMVYGVLQLINFAHSEVFIAGGIVGVAIVGIQRALFSNAAGIGSAAIVAALLYTKKRR